MDIVYTFFQTKQATNVAVSYSVRQAFVGARLSLPYFRRPSFNILTTSAYLEAFNLDTLHARRVVEPRVTSHSTGVGALLGHQLQHRRQKGRDALSLILLKVVLLAQHVR